VWRNYVLNKKQQFDQLNLQMTEETMQNARNEGINQVSGTNQHSLHQLWQAYPTGDPSNELVLKDKPNLAALAKSIAVFKAFSQPQNQSIGTLKTSHQQSMYQEAWQRLKNYLSRSWKDVIEFIGHDPA
jgi:hypothetical protein